MNLLNTITAVKDRKGHEIRENDDIRKTIQEYQQGVPKETSEKLKKKTKCKGKAI